MPRMNGLHVLKKIRETSNIPVLVFSAKDADSDKILGLNLGADDYLTKPFNPLEAVARIQSNIRRFYSLGGHDGKMESETANLKVRDLTWIQKLRAVSGKEPIELSSVDTGLCICFMEHPWKSIYKRADAFRLDGTKNIGR